VNLLLDPYGPASVRRPPWSWRPCRAGVSRRRQGRRRRPPPDARYDPDSTFPVNQNVRLTALLAGVPGDLEESSK